MFLLRTMHFEHHFVHFAWCCANFCFEPCILNIILFILHGVAQNLCFEPCILNIILLIFHRKMQHVAVNRAFVKYFVCHAPSGPRGCQLRAPRLPVPSPSRPAQGPPEEKMQRVARQLLRYIRQKSTQLGGEDPGRRTSRKHQGSIKEWAGKGVGG